MALTHLGSEASIFIQQLYLSFFFYILRNSLNFGQIILKFARQSDIIDISMQLYLFVLNPSIQTWNIFGWLKNKSKMMKRIDWLPILIFTYFLLIYYDFIIILWYRKAVRWSDVSSMHFEFGICHFSLHAFNIWFINFNLLLTCRVQNTTQLDASKQTSQCVVVSQISWGNQEPKHYVLLYFYST